jgi:hypothetical protein
MREHLKNLLGGSGTLAFSTPAFWHGVNELLTTISLSIGIAIGLMTLRRMYRQHQDKNSK